MAAGRQRARERLLRHWGFLRVRAAGGLRAARPRDLTPMERRSQGVSKRGAEPPSQRRTHSWLNVRWTAAKDPAMGEEWISRRFPGSSAVTGGGAGIRTQGTLSRPTVFKTAP